MVRKVADTLTPRQRFDKVHNSVCGHLGIAKTKDALAQRKLLWDGCTDAQIAEFIQQRCERFALQKRGVAGKHQHGAIVIGKLIGAHHYGMSCPFLLGLQRRLHARAERAGEVRDHALGAVPHDHDDLVGAGVERRADGPLDEGPPGDRVKDLRQRALHARSLTCGEDDGGELRHGNAP